MYRLLPAYATSSNK